MLYRNYKPTETSIKANLSKEGETIESKVRRILTNKEPIKDGAPIIYTDRKDGVLPQYDIRTDRFDIAVDTMDKGSKAKIARREQTIAERAKEGMEKEKANEKQVGGPESTYTLS